MKINRAHRIAVIASDYGRSKAFYTGVPGVRPAGEHYRSERDSRKADFQLDGTCMPDLFSFADPPQRVFRPEVCVSRSSKWTMRRQRHGNWKTRERGISRCERTNTRADGFPSSKIPTGFRSNRTNDNA